MVEPARGRPSASDSSRDRRCPCVARRGAQVINENGSDAPRVDQLSRYKDRGLGGVVCNVAFQDYLRSEENWKTLARAVAEFAKLGMVVWIYDEQGYPSGAAGGLVLKENPAI